MPSLKMATDGDDGSTLGISSRARAVASMSTPAKTVVKWSGMTLFWSALVTPGLAPPAAQPQTELTTSSVVPGMATAASTSAAALRGVTPHCESSSHIGRTASGSYKGCILNPPFLFRWSLRRPGETSIWASAASRSHEPDKYYFPGNFRIVHSMELRD